MEIQTSFKDTASLAAAVADLTDQDPELRAYCTDSTLKVAFCL